MFKSKKKRRAKVLANYYKIKREAFSFGSIAQYFLGSGPTDNHQVISDETYRDLDLDELFTFVDRTVSKVGQQYHYYVFRTIPRTHERCVRFEHLIKIFEDDKDLKESVVWQLSHLNRYEAYHITSLIHDPHIQKPSWFWVIHALSLISIFTMLLSFFVPQLLVLLLFILIANYFVHYWNKDNLFQYSGAILQLLKLNQVTQEILKSNAFTAEEYSLHKSIQMIDRVGSRMAIFKLEAKFQSEIGQVFEFIAEIVKALLLIPPGAVQRAEEAQRKKKADSRDLSVCRGN